MTASKPRVLIVDKRAVMGIEMCRALAAQGCLAEVFAAPGSPAFRSRFCSRRLPSPPFDDPPSFLAALSDVVTANRYDAIHVCHEEILSWTLPLTGGVAWRGLLLPSLDRLQIALSKNAMLWLVAQAGVAAPRTIIPKDERSLNNAVREFGTPVVVKGDTGESGENVRLAGDAEDLRSKCHEISNLETRAGAVPAVQEFVRGPAYSIGGLYHRGRPLRVIVHRKLLRYPHPWGGRTVRGVTEECREVRNEAFKVFEALEYTGLGHAEFIRDERDGKFKFLEVNPRVWGTIGVAQSAGVDLFTPYRRLVDGEPVEPDLRYKSGVVFHRLTREIRLMLERPQRVFGFLRDAIDPRVASNFKWSDPGPHLPMMTILPRLRQAASSKNSFPAYESSERQGSREIDA